MENTLERTLEKQVRKTFVEVSGANPEAKIQGGSEVSWQFRLPLAFLDGKRREDGGGQIGDDARLLFFLLQGTPPPKIRTDEILSREDSTREVSPRRDPRGLPNRRWEHNLTRPEDDASTGTDRHPGTHPPQTHNHSPTAVYPCSPRSVLAVPTRCFRLF